MRDRYVRLQDARRVVSTWEVEFFNRSPDLQTKLALMYLANDVLQNSRKKGTQYVQEFYRTLPKPVKHLLKHGDSNVRTTDLLGQCTEHCRMVRGSRRACRSRVCCLNIVCPDVLKQAVTWMCSLTAAIMCARKVARLPCTPVSAACHSPSADGKPVREVAYCVALLPFRHTLYWTDT